MGYIFESDDECLSHHGVKGMRWGAKDAYQNKRLRAYYSHTSNY